MMFGSLSNLGKSVGPKTFQHPFIKIFLNVTKIKFVKKIIIIISNGMEFLVKKYSGYIELKFKYKKLLLKYKKV